MVIVEIINNIITKLQVITTHIMVPHTINNPHGEGAICQATYSTLDLVEALI
uniref:Uncharacterized protein n=1 Tax=Meloidogyne enterolobii TaxID=390850 RepID=A0A6V7VWP1_MELEN|nr:unnamed protein product [Meloidogyne enterolobii]